MYLGECPKIEYGHHFHGNKPREFFSSLYLFILIIINIQWNDWVEKWAKQFLDQPLNTYLWHKTTLCVIAILTHISYQSVFQCLQTQRQIELTRSHPVRALTRKTCAICLQELALMSRLKPQWSFRNVLSTVFWKRQKHSTKHDYSFPELKCVLASIVTNHNTKPSPLQYCKQRVILWDLMVGGGDCLYVRTMYGSWWLSCRMPDSQSN